MLCGWSYHNIKASLLGFPKASTLFLSATKRSSSPSLDSVSLVYLRLEYIFCCLPKRLSTAQVGLRWWSSHEWDCCFLFERVPLSKMWMQTFFIQHPIRCSMNIVLTTFPGWQSSRFRWAQALIREGAKFESKHNSRFLQKSELVDWGSQAPLPLGAGPAGWNARPT